MTTTPNNTNAANDNAQPLDAEAILETLEIHRIERQKLGGAWVTGRIAGHHFQAKVYRGHPEVKGYEMGDSRISKFGLRDSGGEVARFDRGWDLEPTTEVAALIVALLSAGLAEHVFGN